MERGLALSRAQSQRFPHLHPLLELRAICPELSWHLHEVRTLPTAQTRSTSHRAATAAAEGPNGWVDAYITLKRPAQKPGRQTYKCQLRLGRQTRLGNSEPRTRVFPCFLPLPSLVSSLFLPQTFLISVGRSPHWISARLVLKGAPYGFLKFKIPAGISRL